MARLRFWYQDNTMDLFVRSDWSRRCFVHVRLLRTAPACEKSFEVRETTRVTALSDIVEQMPSAAIAIFPALSQEALKI